MESPEERGSLAIKTFVKKKNKQTNKQTKNKKAVIPTVQKVGNVSCIGCLLVVTFPISVF